MNKFIVSIAALALATTAALAQSAPVKTGDSAKGKVLTDTSGMTLYTFDKDTTPGQSACTGGCATAWPGAMADAYDKPSGDWTVIPSADGKKQWAYKGKPVYRFAKDTKAGDMKGDGFKDMWHTAKP